MTHMNQDNELRMNWRRNWLGSIQEFADIDEQRAKWLDYSNLNPHYSFVEYMCSYFNDLGLSDHDNSYAWAIESKLVSQAEAAAVAEFHQLADMYECPNRDSTEHEILADPEWLKVVSAAQNARRQLLDLLNTPRERDILMNRQ